MLANYDKSAFLLKDFSKMADYELIQIFSSQIQKNVEILQNAKFREARDNYLKILEICSQKYLLEFNIIKSLCHNHLGLTFLHMKKFDLSKFHTSQAIKLAGDSNDKNHLNNNLAQAHFGLKEYKEARMLFEEIIKSQNDTKTKIFYARSLYNEDKANATQAISIFEEILKEEPQNINALTYISDAIIKMGLGVMCAQHIIMAISLVEIDKTCDPETAEFAKVLWANLMKDTRNHFIIMQLASELRIFKHVIQIMKEGGAIEFCIPLYKSALDLPIVKANIQEKLIFVANLLAAFEVINKHQECFNIFKAFVSENPTAGMKKLKNSELFKVIENVTDIFDEKYKYEETEWKFPPLIIGDEEFDLSLTPYQDYEIDFLGVYFTIVKILFVAGTLSILPKLIKVIQPMKEGRELHKTIIKNQNSYFSLIISVLCFIKYPLPKTEKKLYVIGDSHCLSLAWQMCNDRLIIPKLVTGCKCWHLQEKTILFTKLNFDRVINSIPDKSSVIFIFGEIDCREAIFRQYERGLYDSLEDGCRKTTDIYLTEVHKLEVSRGFKAYIHPVPPVISFTRIVVRTFNECLRNQKKVEFLDFMDELMGYDPIGFNKKYELDGIHMSPDYKFVLDFLIQ